MNLRQSLVGQAVLLAATGTYSVITAPSLGSTVPTHWGIDGKPDQWGSPAFSLWFGPSMVLFMMAITVVLPKISPSKFEMNRFSDTYGILMFLVALLMAVLHVVILRASAGSAFAMDKVLMIVIGLFFAVFGNFMGKVKRNFYMGVRTPWTLSSERVWDATHRHAAVLWFYGGLLVASSALLGLPFAVSIAVMMLFALWPVVDSYLIYRRLEG